MSQDKIKKIIKEALTGGMETPASITQVVKYSDTPLVKDIIKFFEDNDEGKLINIIGNGENWHMDIRCEIEEGINNQDTRDTGIAYAHSLVNELKDAILEDGHNVPNMSIQGVRTNGNILEFSVGFIYAYKGNQRDLYEENKRAKELIKNIYKNL